MGHGSGRGALRGRWIRASERRRGDLRRPDLSHPPDRLPAARPGCLRGATLAGLLSLLAAVPLSAQSGGVYADGGVTHSLSPSGSELDPATYLLGGLRFDQQPLPGVSLFASLYGGLSLDASSGDWAALAAGGSLSTSPRPGLDLGLGAWASGFTVGAPFRYEAVTGEVVPSAEIRLGDFRLRLRGQGGLGTSDVEVRRLAHRLPAIRPTAAVTTHLWYFGGGPEIEIPIGPATLGVGGGLYDSDLGGYREGFIRLTAGTDVFQGGLDFRVWDTPGGDDVSGGLTVRVPFGPGWSVQAVGGRSEPDPLLQTPAAVQASFVASRRIVGLGESDPTLFSLEPARDGVKVRFYLRRPDAESVEVVGDFSGWAGVEMNGDGKTWSTAVTLEPGVYHFGFRVDGEWFVPEEAPGRIRDEWGRVNATLVVLNEET